ncbi:leucine zipper protein 2-like [Tupaia chinensis]|uniref:leucine zipper protein 2-like n=1 Tax=Tupaia chinensis TaxID=246437 RepID=UPI000FFBEC72|nr:leucine zipper protein 2-like [Tupaia chinensis]
MKFSPAHYLLPLLPALVLGTRQDYEELEKQLKEVFKERSTILRQLTKTSRELDGIKVNLQSLKNDEQSAKTDVQKLLEFGQKQREEMKSLQEALQNQLKETSEKAEKHQATINFLKTEVERKSKMIRDLQNEGDIGPSLWACQLLVWLDEAPAVHQAMLYCPHVRHCHAATQLATAEGVKDLFFLYLSHFYSSV